MLTYKKIGSVFVLKFKCRNSACDLSDLGAVWDYSVPCVIRLSFDEILQMLTIHLEESDCFAAWVSAREVGINPSLDAADPKCTFFLDIRCCTHPVE
jgi:hypothetical protein